MAAIKGVMGFPFKDTQYIPMPSNDQVFRLFKRRYKPVVESLFPSCGERYSPSGIWLTKHPNRSKLDPIILYLHGGAYYLQTQVGQLKSVAAVAKLVDANKKLSVMSLDYDLASRGHLFPRQLRQLDAIYSKLVEEGNDNLILMGDSAGGHLAISYTEFIKFKRPYLPYPLKLLLISPWVNLGTSEKDYKPGLSYYDNQSRDIINYLSFDFGGKMEFIPDEKEIDHRYFDWSYTGQGHWEDNGFFNKPNNNHDVFLITGEDESFRDHIIDWTRQIYQLPLINALGNSNNKFLPEFEIAVNDPKKPKLKMLIEPWGTHDSFCIAEATGLDQILNNKPMKEHEYFCVLKLANFLNETL